MTHPLAALIAGVPRRYDIDPVFNYLREDLVLAALEAATPPDLVEAGKVLEGVTPGPWVYEYTGIGHTVRQPGAYNAIFTANHAGNFEPDARFIAWCREGVPALIALATAQAVQIAGLAAKARESAMQELASLGQAQDAYEAQKAAEAEAATLLAEVEGLRGALKQIIQEDQREDTWHYWEKEDGHFAKVARAALEGKV